MDEMIKTQKSHEVPNRKIIKHTRFFRQFGHDARHDWLFLLCLSTFVIAALLAFAVWIYLRVDAEKTFSFETEPISVPSLTVSSESFAQTIDLFENKKVRFNSIWQIGVDAFDPSL